MSADPPSQPPRLVLPPDFLLDDLTWYVYRHFSHLLTEEELAAERIRIGRAKQLASSQRDEDRLLEFFRVPEVEVKYPDLLRKIKEHGFTRVMRAAAERVLRDNPEKKILHTCAKCGALCRTPRSQQCFACGFDWHSQEPDNRSEAD